VRLHLGAIVRDVQRRLIAPATDPAEAIREYATRRLAARSDMDTAIERFGKLFPEMRITKNDSGEGAGFSWSAGTNEHFYLTGRISPNGAVTIDRIQSVSDAMLTDFAAVIRKHFPGKD
jgi:hypothetical protein